MNTYAIRAKDWVATRIVAVLLVIAVANSIRAQGVAEDAAAAAARKRQGLDKTLRMDFKRTDVEAAGSRSGPLPAALKPKSAIPDRETTSESVNRVILDGDK